MSQEKEKSHFQKNSYQFPLGNNERSLEVNIHVDNKQLLALLLALFQKVEFLSNLLVLLAQKQGVSTDELDNLLQQSSQDALDLFGEILEKTKN